MEDREEKIQEIIEYVSEASDEEVQKIYDDIAGVETPKEKPILRGRLCPYCNAPLKGKSEEFIDCPKCGKSVQLF